MGNDEIRYNGSLRPKFSFKYEYLVECPKCKKEGFVFVDNAWFQNNANFKCRNCFFKESIKDYERYNVIVNRYCDNCGNKIKVEILECNEKRNEIKIACPKCNSLRIYEPRNEKILLKPYSNTSKIADPIFNLPLWLQMEFRKNIFWAYNKDHLGEIRNYVKSELRERQTLNHTTMVEKLPKFITSSKNREGILRVIEKLDRK